MALAPPPPPPGFVPMEQPPVANAPPPPLQRNTAAPPPPPPGFFPMQTAGPQPDDNVSLLDRFRANFSGGGPQTLLESIAANVPRLGGSPEPQAPIPVPPSMGDQSPFSLQPSPDLAGMPGGGLPPAVANVPAFQNPALNRTLPQPIMDQFQQYAQAEKAETLRRAKEAQFAFDQMPSWTQADGATSLLQGGAALTGSLVRSLASPEGIVGAPEAEAVMAGRAILPQMIKGGLIQSGVAGGANLLSQQINVAGGIKDDIDPGEAVNAAIFGGGIGMAFPGAAGIVRAFRGITPPHLQPNMLERAPAPDRPYTPQELALQLPPGYDQTDIMKIALQQGWTPPPEGAITDSLGRVVHQPIDLEAAANLTAPPPTPPSPGGPVGAVLPPQGGPVGGAVTTQGGPVGGPRLTEGGNVGGAVIPQGGPIGPGAQALGGPVGRPRLPEGGLVGGRPEPEPPPGIPRETQVGGPVGGPVPREGGQVGGPVGETQVGGPVGGERQVGGPVGGPRISESGPARVPEAPGAAAPGMATAEAPAAPAPRPSPVRVEVSPDGHTTIHIAPREPEAQTAEAVATANQPPHGPATGDKTGTAPAAEIPGGEVAGASPAEASRPAPPPPPGFTPMQPRPVEHVTTPPAETPVATTEPPKPALRPAAEMSSADRKAEIKALTTEAGTLAPQIREQQRIAKDAAKEYNYTGNDSTRRQRFQAEAQIVELKARQAEIKARQAELRAVKGEPPPAPKAETASAAPAPVATPPAETSTAKPPEPAPAPAETGLGLAGKKVPATLDGINAELKALATQAADTVKERNAAKPADRPAIQARIDEIKARIDEIKARQTWLRHMRNDAQMTPAMRAIAEADETTAGGGKSPLTDEQRGKLGDLDQEARAANSQISEIQGHLRRLSREPDNAGNRAERAILEKHLAENKARLAEVEAEQTRIIKGEGETLGERPGRTPENIEANVKPENETGTTKAPIETGDGETLADRSGRNPQPQTREGTGTLDPQLGRGPVGRTGETSPYREVFRDAGYDPNVMVNRPLAVQNRVLTDHVQSTFGFGSITSSISPLETRNYLSDFYQNARAFAAVNGLPYKAVGMDGRIHLELHPPSVEALGSYNLGNRVLRIHDRSDSFIHEWTHAWDHQMSDRFGQRPRLQRILSEDPNWARRQMPPGHTPLTGEESFARVIGSMYGNDTNQALRALKLHFDADPRTQPNKFIRAKARKELATLESEFARQSRDFGAQYSQSAARYYSRPAEMLARAHEAYQAFKIEQGGYDTRGVVRPDSMYSADAAHAVSQQFEKIYPKAEDRLRVFQALDDHFDAIRREHLLGTDQPGVGPSGLDIADPRHWAAMADTTRGARNVSVLRAELNALRNIKEQMLERAGFDRSRPLAPGDRTLGQRAANNAKAWVYTIRSLMEELAHQQTPAARAIVMRDIVDHLTPARGLRTAAEARGRYVGETYEAHEQYHFRRNMKEFGDIVDATGLRMNDRQSADWLQRVMSGDTDLRGIPQNIVEAGGALRALMDREHERLTKAGVDLGYTESYYQRKMDEYQVYNNLPQFKEDAARAYMHVYDRDVGDTREMLDAWRDMSDHGKSYVPQTVQDDLARLAAIEKQRASTATRLSKMEPGSPEAADAMRRLAQHEAEADAIRQSVEPHVRTGFGHDLGEKWRHRIAVGHPIDFDTHGPKSSLTKSRVLTPEADAILREHYITDPFELLPSYFRQSSRLSALAEHFGNNGTGLEDALTAASKAGMHPEDVRTMRGYVERIIGAQRSDLPKGVSQSIDAIHAIGSMALMPRAVMTALSEPMAAIATMGNVKSALNIFAGQIGDVFHTAHSRDVEKLMQAAGITTSALTDSTYASRLGTNYADSPNLARLMTWYYRRTGLTQLTNSQKRHAAVSSHLAFNAWAEDLLNGTAKEKHEAAAQFRDLGIADAHQEDFAKWLKQKGDMLPSTADLETPAGQLWRHGVSELVNRTIQEVRRSDKPLMSTNPMGKLMFGLMSFNYSFFHNVVDRTLATHGARVSEATGFGGKASALAGAAGHLAMTGIGLYAASLAATTVREAIFNSQKWKEQSQQGQLFDWLSDLAIQRTGINGPLDPLLQAVHGLKYDKSLTGLFAGAQVGFITQAAENILGGAVRGSPNTNTSEYNAIKGAFNLVAVPLITMGLTAMPGGPISSKLMGAAMMYGTSRDAADTVATELVGEKGSRTAKVGGSRLGGRFADDEEGGGDGSRLGSRLGGLGSGAGKGAEGASTPIPWGLADDLAVPVGRRALPLLGALPGPLKLLGAGGIAAATTSALAKEFGQYVRPPPKKGGASRAKAFLDE